MTFTNEMYMGDVEDDKQEGRRVRKMRKVMKVMKVRRVRRVRRRQRTMFRFKLIHHAIMIIFLYDK